MFNTTW